METVFVSYISYGNLLAFGGGVWIGTLGYRTYCIADCPQTSGFFGCDTITCLEAGKKKKNRNVVLHFRTLFIIQFLQIFTTNIKCFAIIFSRLKSIFLPVLVATIFTNVLFLSQDWSLRFSTWNMDTSYWMYRQNWSSCHPYNWSWSYTDDWGGLIGTIGYVGLVGIVVLRGTWGHGEKSSYKNL